MIMEEEHEIMNRSLRRKKSSVVENITCCFNGSSTHAHHRRRASLDGNVPFTVSSSASHNRKTTTTSAWFKSKTNDLPEIKGRCRSFISRMGRHRRHASADFSYDPLSYSLNFDHVDEPSSSHHPVMDFNARLPLTPPRRPLEDQHHSLPRSSPEGNEDLRRGFEALSVSLKGSPVRSGQRRNNKSNTDQEEVTPNLTPPLPSSSNHGVLVQLC